MIHEQQDEINSLRYDLLHVTAERDNLKTENDRLREYISAERDISSKWIQNASEQRAAIESAVDDLKAYWEDAKDQRFIRDALHTLRDIMKS